MNAENSFGTNTPTATGIFTTSGVGMLVVATSFTGPHPAINVSDAIARAPASARAVLRMSGACLVVVCCKATSTRRLGLLRRGLQGRQIFGRKYRPCIADPE